MKYNLFPQFIVRTPYAPFNILEKIKSRNDLFKYVSDHSDIQEALYIASPILYKELHKYYEGNLTDEKEVDKLYNSITRYVNRMATRCTPFGLFAACSIGNISSNSNTKIELCNSFNRSTRLDMLYLCNLCDELLIRSPARYKILYTTNTSLYPLGKKYRYVEYSTINNKRFYRLAEIDKSSYLNKVLKLTEVGATFDDLSKSLIDKEINKEDADDFINELIDSQIIQNQLSQSVTGDDFLSQLINLLQAIEYDKERLSLLVSIKDAIYTLDNEGHGISLYQEIIKKIDLLNIHYDEKYLFQVDMIRNTSTIELGGEILEELKSTMTFLNKITPSGENPTLTQFKQSFINRYENREVPLIDVLDTELGLGYPAKSNDGDISPLVDDLYIPPRVQASNMSKLAVHSSLYSLLLNKTIECLSTSKKEIELFDEDIKNAIPTWNNLPPTLYSMFNIIEATPNNILIKLKTFSGSCGANLFTRFAHADKKIEKLIENIVETEQKILPHVILGEIVHLPEARVGNVLYRPHIREYELVYMGSSSLPKEKKIMINDLMLSIRQNKLILRSKKINKEVVPRLTTAHNYKNMPLPIYHLLCDIQIQEERAGLYFSWGELENDLLFRPRVKYRNTILSEASWTINITDMEFLFTRKDDLLNEVNIWIKKRGIPQHVVLADGDNELFVNWTNLTCVEALFSIIKKRKIIILKEAIFNEEKAVVKHNNNSFLNECIVVFHKKTSQ